MNTKILITVVLLLITTEAIGRQCYQCIFCPKPFNGNEAGITKIDVGDNDFCQKIIVPITLTENRGNGGSDCTPVDKYNFCCKGDLCNGATTSTLSVKLLVATASLFCAVRFFY